MKTKTIIFILLVVNLSLTNCIPSRAKTPQLIPLQTENSDSNSSSRLLTEEESNPLLTFNGEDLFSILNNIDDVYTGDIIGDDYIISEEEFFGESGDFEDQAPEIREEWSDRNLKMVKNSGNFRRSN